MMDSNTGAIMKHTTAHPTDQDYCDRRYSYESRGASMHMPVHFIALYCS